MKSRCKFLEKDQQRNKHLASEWQDFGRYTAHVLKNEVETATTKIKYLEVRVEDLRKENKELKDVCLYLDQSQTGESKLTPPELSELLAQTNFLSKLNLKSRVPHFADSLATLQAGQNTMVEQLTGKSNMTEALIELGRRVESLEKEKLELIKVEPHSIFYVIELYLYTKTKLSFHIILQSLSAAHLLVANTKSPGNSLLFKGAPTPRMIEHPPKLDTLLQTDEPDVGIPLRNISPEIVTVAVMVIKNEPVYHPYCRSMGCTMGKN